MPCTGTCYDNYHNVIESGCFDVPASVNGILTTNDVLSFYPSLNGFVLSAAMKGHPALNTAYWNVAPEITPQPDRATSSS